jgi:hypothetical protein
MRVTASIWPVDTYSATSGTLFPGSTTITLNENEVFNILIPNTFNFPLQVSMEI